MKNGLKKTIIAFLTALIAVCVFACKEAESDKLKTLSPEELFATYSAYAVELQAGSATGSGFIAEGENDYVYIISCFHVAKTEVPGIKFYGEDFYTSPDDTRIIGYDEKADVIVYRTAKSGFDGKGILASGAISSSVVGKKVALVASPFGDGISYLESRISLAEDVQNVGGVNRLVTRISGGIYDGSSGGMAINEYGLLVGTAIGRNAEAAGNDMCYITPAATVKAIYDAVRAGKVTDGAGTTYRHELLRPDFSVRKRLVSTNNALRDVKEIVVERNGKSYAFEQSDGKLYILGCVVENGALSAMDNGDERGAEVTRINGSATGKTFTETVSALLGSGTTEFRFEADGAVITL